MKCNNCGFVNESGALKCIKCNSPLSKSAPDSHEQKQGTSVDEIGPAENQKIFKTLLGEQAREKFIDRPGNFESAAPKEQHHSAPKECPHCGYQLMVAARICPNCNEEVTGGTKNPIKESKPSANFKGTIDPYSQKGFILRPIVNGSPAKEGLQFNGGTTSLNRDNTIKDNMTITSKTQAEIILDNGEWFIVDKSEKQTTFVRPGQPIKLNKGDIILLGDTKFIFE